MDSDSDSICALVRRIIDVEVKPTFLAMLSESEKRIDRTNEMICRLAEACKNIDDAYLGHITSLQRSRDIQQEVNVNLREELSRSSAERERLLGLLAKEIAEKDSLRRELHKAADRYTEMFEAYTRLSEMANTSGGSSSDVKINL